MKKLWSKIVSDIFAISLISYMVYLALELLFEGLISNYFDLNILLAGVIASGFLTVLAKRKNML